MARKLLSRPRLVVNQSGAPESVTDENTIVIGRQVDEKADEKPKAPAKS